MEPLDSSHTRVVGVRAPWRAGAFSPQELALALQTRRGQLLRELSAQRYARGVPEDVLCEVVDDAICAVVMKPRPIASEEHMRCAFWRSAQMLLARYHGGRHRVRLGSRRREHFDIAAEVASGERSPAEQLALHDAIARAADWMAQLDALEARVTALMALRGVGVKRAARELGVGLGEVKAAARSAEIKLEQVAAIAAAGRMCEYRGRAIAAHARGDACEREARLARAHIQACPACRRTYVRMVREMRGRDFRRGASAAFLPAPLLPAVAHGGLAARLSAFLFDPPAPSWGGTGERTAGLLGGGGLVKAAAAGTAVVIAGAGFGGRVLHSLDGRSAGHTRGHVAARRLGSVRTAALQTAAPAHTYAAAPIAPAPVRATPASQAAAARDRRLPSRGLGYLAVGAGTRDRRSVGAESSVSDPSSVASVASSPPGEAGGEGTGPASSTGPDRSEGAPPTQTPPPRARSGGGTNLSYLGG